MFPRRVLGNLPTPRSNRTEIGPESLDSAGTDFLTGRNRAAACSGSGAVGVRSASLRFKFPTGRSPNRKNLPGSPFEIRAGESLGILDPFVKTDGRFVIHPVGL
jgi:hypothetical protein